MTTFFNLTRFDGWWFWADNAWWIITALHFVGAFMKSEVNSKLTRKICLKIFRMCFWIFRVLWLYVLGAMLGD